MHWVIVSAGNNRWERPCKLAACVARSATHGARGTNHSLEAATLSSRHTRGVAEIPSRMANLAPGRRCDQSHSVAQTSTAPHARLCTVTRPTSALPAIAALTTLDTPVSGFEPAVATRLNAEGKLPYRGRNAKVSKVNPSVVTRIWSLAIAVGIDDFPRLGILPAKAVQSNRG